jgi:hypothetical protein
VAQSVTEFVTATASVTETVAESVTDAVAGRWSLVAGYSMLDARSSMLVAAHWSLLASTRSSIVATCHPGQLSAPAPSQAPATTVPAETVFGVAPEAAWQRPARELLFTAAVAVAVIDAAAVAAAGLVRHSG